MKRLKTSGYRRCQRVGLLVIILSWYGISYIFPHIIWSSSSVTVIPLLLQLVFFFLMTSLILPEVVIFYDKLLGLIGEYLFKGKNSQNLVLFFLVIASILIIGWDDTVFVGDSNEISGYIRFFPSIFKLHSSYHRIAITSFYWMANEVFSSFVSSWRIVSIIHFAIGILFSWVALKIADCIFEKPKQKLQGLIIILFGGTLLLFLHNEFYAPAALFIIIAYLSLIKGIRLNSSVSAGFYLLSLIAFVFHPLLFFIASFGVVGTVIMKNGKKALFFNIAIFISLIFALTILPRFFGDSISDRFLLLSNIHYLFSGSHFILLLNYMIFAIPAILTLPILWNFKSSDKLQRVLLWCAFISVSVVLLIRFDLGAADWDFAAMLLIPATIFASYTIVKYKDTRIVSLVTMLSVFSFMINLFINANSMSTITRATQLNLRQNIPMRQDFVDTARLASLHKTQFEKSGNNNYKKYAIELSYRSIESCPKEDRSYLILSSIYQLEGNYTFAEEILRLGTKKGVDRRTLMLVKLGQLYEETDKYDKLLELESNMMKIYMKLLKSKNEIYSNIKDYTGAQIADYAEKKLSEGDTIEARRIFSKATDIYHAGPLRYHMLFTFFSEKHEHKKALEQLRLGMFFRPNNPWLHIAMAKLLMQLGYADSTEYYLNRTIEFCPNCASAHSNWALLLFKKGLHDSAITHINIAIALEPDDKDLKHILDGFMEK